VFAQGLSIGPLVPLVLPDAGPMFAEQLEKMIELKSANVSTPELEEGASSIHSAEDRCALFVVCVVLYDFPVELSVRVNVNLFDPAKTTEALIESPA